tara:strand:- start:750 stop:1349 length:600 start_codon:yes stop_codon:yes gene_type:complete
MLERVGIEGFLRGRRYDAINGKPQFFHFYETTKPEVLTSPAYMQRLNNPTPWTQRIGPHIKNNNRTLSQVIHSVGCGVGAAILTIRMVANHDREIDFFQWVSQELFPFINKKPGVIAAHLLKGDKQASETETEEKAMRDKPDEVADWIIFLEAIDDKTLLKILDKKYISAKVLIENGAYCASIGTYKLHFSLSSEDLIK